MPVQEGGRMVSHALQQTWEQSRHYPVRARNAHVRAMPTSTQQLPTQNTTQLY
jgi:hypothetical protein